MAVQYIPVEALQPGHYVSALDRPWVETPFLFQGFEITSHNELETLRTYCRHVWVDCERSRVAVETASRPEATCSDLAPLKRQFKDGLEALGQAREMALDACTRVNTRLRKYSQLDLDELAPAVTELHTQVTAYPQVARWLLTLREHEDTLAEHSVNVCTLAIMMGQALKMETWQQAEMALGGLLHDVGKLCLPPRLLSKQAPLSSTEWKQIQQAPVYGHKLLQDCGLHPRVLTMVRNHQERLDGSGFPDGLRGEQIEQPVRVIGLVNAYDAMTMSRPGFPAMSGYRAMLELARQAGHRWDPELVQSFVLLMGIYPAGTCVSLDNGSRAVVVDSKPEARLNPIIAMRRGNGAKTRWNLTDLSLPRHPRRIRSLDPPDWDHSRLMRFISDQLLAA
ncbi:HD-GYP domain-containing protein [Natronospira bacteriovora]|uniref:HD-GYP domain-containing protein n=1 Tax=Natronospira bacteriovora TaxID=3069753 RepID=A0ABU0W8P2_9GAMM|nr:HD-GYP domain-containing protein [Natronospira sp. AB-CW4]MDQ2070404.1 HD-GYP domain-containing protein [Natronospira sp. AB-CW4]